MSTTVEVEGREEKRVVEMPAFEPEPWGEDAALHVVGERSHRVDGAEKVAGRARYAADVQRPGMLHAVLVRAPIARGHVRRIDAAAALAMPGVRAVLTRADVPRIDVRGVPFLDPVVLYAGQPVAVVCADDADTATRAARSVTIDYQAEPHAVTPERALAATTPLVRGASNLTEESPIIAERGDVERGLREADVVVTREYRTPVALHSALETHGAVAEWQGGRLTLWESTQGIFRVREQVAAALELPLSSVRVIKEYMGGGFGAKSGAGAYSYAAALLSRGLGRPVRCVLDRDEEQTDTGNRPATIQRVTLAARRDGRLTAISCEATVPLGIGGWEGGPGKIYHEMYSCPNVRTSETFVYVNAAAMSSFRAPGHAEGAFGLESAMDALARALSLDPLALRQSNYAERDEEKNRPYSSKRLDLCYREGARRFGWARRTRAARERTGPRGERLRRGFGMASQIWGAGGGPPAYAQVRLDGDGSVEVLTGTQDLGTGARTVLAQIAAESLGARLDGVRVVLGDTERTPYAGTSWGSMTTPSVGPAVRLAAEDARQQLLEAAGELMGASPSSLDVRDGIVRRRGSRDRMTFAEIAEELEDVMIIGQGSRGPNPDGIKIATFGAQFVEVEVDVDTGVVQVVRVVAAHDGGRIINPRLAESQLEGGILQGLGYALFEERVLDAPLGLPLNPTLHDYKIPTMADAPKIEAFFLPGADATANHVGALGIAEPPIIPTAPAIANAVADALGVEVREIPLTPWRVIAAMRAPQVSEPAPGAPAAGKRETRAPPRPARRRKS